MSTNLLSVIHDAIKRKELDRKTRRAGADYEELGTEQQKMIKSVVEFPETTVKEVMVPRVDTDFLDADLPNAEILSKITASGHSRFPVYRGTIDTIIGILHVKDVLKYVLKNRAQGAEKSPAPTSSFLNAQPSPLRDPFFVPESRHIDMLLRDLRKRHTQIAVVVDEYGGVSGIVCMEDLIEEIVGEIQDEFDDDDEDIIKLGADSWQCNTRMNLEDFAEKMGVDRPEGDFDTLGGFVYNLFGKIPVRFEKTSWGDFDVIVQEVKGQRINTVKLVKKTE
jgi:CBS domain containing-hemolysin-like protein